MKLLFSALLLVSAVPTAHAAEVILSCTETQLTDIKAVEVILPARNESDITLLKLTLADGTITQSVMSYVDFEQGYIELPMSDGFDRVLSREEDGWYILKMKPKKMGAEFIKTNCKE